MRNHFLAFAGGVAAAIGVGMLAHRSDKVRGAARQAIGAVKGAAASAGVTTVDLNHASADELKTLGLDTISVDRVIENRPYRNKLELVERFILTRPEYDDLRDKISVTDREAHEGISVAS